MERKAKQFRGQSKEANHGRRRHGLRYRQDLRQFAVSYFVGCHRGEEAVADRDAYVYIRPQLKTSLYYYLVLAIGLAGSIWFFYGAFIYQFFSGHHITGQGTQGAMWGTMVANIIQLIGVSHVGIAISASVRILKLRRYMQLARVAELVTLVSLTAAVCNIAMDVGRPDRFLFSVLINGNWTAPFVWSCTVITAYLVGSSFYLYLAMRRDIYVCSRILPRRSVRWFYKLLALGYRDTPEEVENHERTVHWVAVIILPIMVSVHSVYGYVFGLQPGRPGWYNPFQAPYFVLGAIVTGFSCIIVVAAILRRVYRWQEIYTNRMFKGLGIFLGFITLLYLYFLSSEWLTGIYASPEAEREVFNDVLFGRFAPLTWAATIAGMVIPFWILFIQGANPKICSMKLVVVGAIPIFFAMWIWRLLIVLPSFYHPHIPYRVAPYSPTLFDWSLVAGSYFFALFFYAVLVKLVPVLEIPHDFVPQRPVLPLRLTLYQRKVLGRLKRVLVVATALAGAGLMAYGFATREHPPAPAIWMAGIVVLWLIPLEACMIPGYVRRRPRKKGAEKVRSFGLLHLPQPVVTLVGAAEAGPESMRLRSWLERRRRPGHRFRRRMDVRTWS